MSVGRPDFHLYDTTLRDGTQQEGLVLSVGDKLAVAAHLDAFGVTFIEGGWPGAIPKDTEFFRRAAGGELKLRNAQLVAFGSTRRPDYAVHQDPQVAALLAAETPVVTLVAKADSRHVDLALRTTKSENLAMIRDTVRHLVREGRRVFLDAEHYFDGYAKDRAYALEVVQVAAEAGAEVVVLCDTNGGTLPEDLGSVLEVTARTGVRLGIHCHDDSGCAVANTLLAVDAGATHVQATAHGYGERCGNANLFTVAANLVLKRNLPIVAAENLASLSSVAQAITEITSAPAARSAPYVGAAAFTHKAGLHASAIRVDPSLYQHVEPALVGNNMRTLVSDMAGRAAIELKAKELGYEPSFDVLTRVSAKVKELERQGYTFETANASFELLLLSEMSAAGRPFEVDTWRLTLGFGPAVPGGEAPATGPRPAGTQADPPWPGGSGVFAQVSLRLLVGGDIVGAAGTGTSPIEALLQALKSGLGPSYPDIERWRLSDCQAWSLDGSLGQPTATRAVVTLEDGAQSCSTVGVDEDNLTASWRALQDAVAFVLISRKRALSGV